MPFVHVWFSIKGRRRILEGDLLESTRRELRTAAERHSVSLLECEGVVDHVHILLELNEINELPRTMSLLKGASARALFLEMPDLKHDMHFNELLAGEIRIEDRPSGGRSKSSAVHSHSVGPAGKVRALRLDLPCPGIHAGVEAHLPNRD